MTMQSTDKEWLNRARVEAEGLSYSLKTIMEVANNPLLPECIADMLSQALAMADKLARLEALVAEALENTPNQSSFATHLQALLPGNPTIIRYKTIRNKTLVVATTKYDKKYAIWYVNNVKPETYHVECYVDSYSKAINYFNNITA